MSGMPRIRRRRIATATLIVGLIGAWAPPIVDAHVEFEGAPATVAPDTDIALTIHVPNEREATNFNVGVAIRLPEGWTGVECETKPTWTCVIATESQRDVIRFTKDQGAAAAEDETFNITLHSGTTVGTASFPTLQTYDTGEEVGWVGDPGSDEPAPTLEVADAATPTTAVEPTAAATTDAGTDTTVAPATTAASVDTTVAEPTTTAGATTTIDTTTADTTAGTVTLEPTVTQPAEDDSDDNNTALIVVVVLVLAAAAAGTIIYMRNRNPTPPTP
jgi:Domain of unkown function (DUF1775)